MCRCVLEGLEVYQMAAVVVVVLVVVVVKSLYKISLFSDMKQRNLVLSSSSSSKQCKCKCRCK